jgi:hypothetical protein
MTDGENEARQRYETAMGQALGSAFHRLWNDLAILQLTWSEFVVAFGTSEARVDLMNRSAKGFFGLTQDAIWNDVILRICRFTDPEKVSGRETLSLRYLLQLLTDYHFRMEILSLIETAREKSKPVRDWRDRLLAHRDRHLALKLPGVKPLEATTVQITSEAIDAITTVMSEVERRFCGECTRFDFISHLGDVEALLRVLRDGLDARDEARERLRAGTGDATFFVRPLP